MTETEMMKNIEALAIRTAKRGDIACSSAYDIAREMWGLWWKLKTSVDANAPRDHRYDTSPGSDTHCMGCGNKKA